MQCSDCEEENSHSWICALPGIANFDIPLYIMYFISKAQTQNTRAISDSSFQHRKGCQIKCNSAASVELFREYLALQVQRSVP